MKPVRWGVLGASNFARKHMVPAILQAEHAAFDAIATSEAAKAAPFVALQPDVRVVEGYEALLSDPAIEALYTPLPNTLHVEWTLKALEAGKHVLCEKPLGLVASDFDPVIAKRDETGLLAAEAFIIVHHPQFIRAREMVQGGAIGRLRHVDAAFSYRNTDPTNIRNKPEVGGGGLPDIGVYTFGAARYVTGEEPLSIPHARIEREGGVDTFVHMSADFPGFTYAALVSTRIFPRQEVVFHGEEGVLRVTTPFNANVFGQAELVLETAGMKVTTERFPGVNHYVLQVEAFCRSLREGVPYPCPLEFSRGTQAMIDMTYAAARG